MAQISNFIFKALMIALVATVSVSGQGMPPAPSPNVDSAGISLATSTVFTVFVGTSLIFSLIALMRN